LSNKTALENLDAKISLILERYTYLKRENARLREENSKLVAKLNATKELLVEKREEIVSLKEKNIEKKAEPKIETTKSNKKVDKQETSRYNVYSFFYKKILQKSMGTTWFRLD